MTGLEARDYVLDQISERDPKGDSASIKLSRHLATDLLKLRREDVGEISQEMFTHGIDALKQHRLFGYKVDIDPDVTGPVVEFGP
ncbi:hypothetical protein [Pedosphaera parvula]|uniref:Uncharacterized protein n=1 Tax=Pedosphaera parvula (strain Ellin514) TaxID=320771 RepID=B9XSL9_PEDPL|nr:hypothetical protein [Pedosphaera parvula]EEF57179.1 hypothetical protein Cflav_PD0145 [Pedosphaera parvula Ellin514]